MSPSARVSTTVESMATGSKRTRTSAPMSSSSPRTRPAAAASNSAGAASRGRWVCRRGSSGASGRQMVIEQVSRPITSSNSPITTASAAVAICRNWGLYSIWPTSNSTGTTGSRA